MPTIIVPTEITNKNIKKLVANYIMNKKKLPLDLRTKKIGNWDVSHVTDMSRLFYRCDDFDEPLNKWNVSNVTNMEAMFEGCENFDQPLNNWDVSNVTNMKKMFFDCPQFNRSLNKWNVYNVKDMSLMFAGCTSLIFNPKWTINEEANTRFMFLDTYLENVVLEKGPYNIKEANENVKNTINELSKVTIETNPGTKTRLPKELITEVSSYFDPYNLTKTRKSEQRTRETEIERMQKHPPGGGYAGGRRRKTQKRNKKF